MLIWRVITCMMYFIRCKLVAIPAAHCAIPPLFGGKSSEKMRIDLWGMLDEAKVMLIKWFRGSFSLVFSLSNTYLWIGSGCQSF